MGKQIKSKLGQNFLVDRQARQRIVQALGPAALGDVIEIGPGKAAITEMLAQHAARLTAIELDPVLAAGLRTHFAGTPSVAVLEADVLTVDLSALARAPGRTLAVIGNLPYYITSPILQHLFAHEQVLSQAVIMVQREVGERITAAPGRSDYGLLSVLCQVHGEPELLFQLPPSAFAPPPEVESAVVRLRFAPRWAELGVAPEPFLRFLRAAFAQKRKTLANNLRAAGHGPEVIGAALAAADCRGSERAEELSPVRLAAALRALIP